MTQNLKQELDAGNVERVRALLAEFPSLASTLIKWGSMFCPCKSEPLHYLSDAPFNQIFNHGRQAELAKVLIEAGAPVDGLPTSGETPLHGAVSLGEAGVAAVLIDQGANIEAVAKYPGIPHGTPLDFAVHFGMVDVVDLLVARGAKIHSARMTAGAGQLDRIESEIEALQSKPNELIDAFRCAAVCDRIHIVQFLLSNGVDANIDIEGATALHWAAWEAKPQMVNFLLQQGGDAARLDQKHKLTPQGWAEHRQKEIGSRWGHERVIQILANHDAG